MGGVSCTEQTGFFTRLRRLREWAETALPDRDEDPSPRLVRHTQQFSRSYDHQEAHRTSNMVDRLMKFFDRACFNGQYFHGLFEAAENRVRALALLWNFCPSSPQTVCKHDGQACPAERLTASAMQIIGWRICGFVAQ